MFSSTFQPPRRLEPTTAERCNEYGEKNANNSPNNENSDHFFFIPTFTRNHENLFAKSLIYEISSLFANTKINN